MTYARRVDKLQGAIVRELRKSGYQVFITSGLGDGFPDLLVGSKKGTLVLFELKSGREPLTRFEQRFHREFASSPVHVVETATVALGWMRHYDQI